MRSYSLPLLPEAEIRALIAQYRTGDNAAAEKVIAHNENAIYRLARRYHSTGVCGDVPMDDLVQLGRIGILRAMQDFRLDSQSRFMTYAWYWIRQYISRYGKREGQQVSLSYKASEHRGRVGRVMALFEQEHSRRPTSKEISQITGLDETYLASLRANVKSLESKVTPNDDRTLADVIADPDEDPAAECEEAMMKALVAQKLRTISPKYRKILTRYYGLDGKPAASLTAIAKKLGVTTERARQIRDDALEQLRQSVNS